MRNNFFDIPGFESIDFQSSSMLGADLSKALSDASTEIDKLWMNSKQDNIEIRLKVKAYCSKVLVPRIKEIARKDAGIEFVQVFVFGDSVKHSAFGLFAVDLSLDDGGTVTDLMNRETGTSCPANIKVDEKYLEELTHMSELLDLKSGKLKSNKYGSGKKRISKAKLYFDMEFAFLGKYLFHDYVDRSKVVPTPDEVAAILLHEIGHMLTMIEHASDMFATANRIRETVNLSNLKDTFSNNKKTEDFVKKNKIIIGNIQKKLMLIPGARKSRTTNQLLKLVTDGIAKIEELTRSISNVHVRNILLLVTTVMMCSIEQLLIIWPLTVVFLDYLSLSFINAVANVETPDDIGKRTDRSAGYNQIFLFERWADDFAAHQGFGPELASGLNKLIYGCEHNSLITFDSRLRNSTAYYCVTNLLEFLLALPTTITCIPLNCNLYEETVPRIRRIREDTYAFFRNNQDAPVEVINNYLNKIDRLNAEIEKAEDQYLLPESVRNTITRIWNNITPSGIMSLLNDGNLKRDLDLINNQIDAMSNNSLYYWSDKFKYS